MKGVDWVQVVGECGDRVGWNREQVLCFHPADPSVVEVVTKEDVQYGLVRFGWIEDPGQVCCMGRGGRPTPQLI